MAHSAGLPSLVSDPNIFVNAQIGRTEGDSSHAAEDRYYYPIKCLSTQSTQWLHLPIYVQIHIKLDQATGKSFWPFLDLKTLVSCFRQTIYLL